MSMGIQSFDNLHDNRVLRYCTDFEAHTLHMDTRTEAGENVSVHFTGLLAHWFENVIQDNILFGMDEITADCLLRLSRLLQHRGTAGAHGYEVFLSAPAIRCGIAIRAVVSTKPCAIDNVFWDSM